MPLLNSLTEEQLLTRQLLATLNQVARAAVRENSHHLTGNNTFSEQEIAFLKNAKLKAISFATETIEGRDYLTLQTNGENLTFNFNESSESLRHDIEAATNKEQTLYQFIQDRIGSLSFNETYQQIREILAPILTQADTKLLDTVANVLLNEIKQGSDFSIDNEDDAKTRENIEKASRYFEHQAIINKLYQECKQQTPDDSCEEKDLELLQRSFNLYLELAPTFNGKITTSQLKALVGLSDNTDNLTIRKGAFALFNQVKNSFAALDRKISNLQDRGQTAAYEAAINLRGNAYYALVRLANNEDKGIVLSDLNTNKNSALSNLKMQRNPIWKALDIIFTGIVKAIKSVLRMNNDIHYRFFNTDSRKVIESANQAISNLNVDEALGQNTTAVSPN